MRGDGATRQEVPGCLDRARTRQGHMDADALKLLQLLVEWGADESIGDAPTDRLAPVSEPAAAIAAPPEPRRIIADVAAVECAQAEVAGAHDLETLRAAITGFDAIALRDTASGPILFEGDPTSRLLIGTAPAQRRRGSRRPADGWKRRRVPRRDARQHRVPGTCAHRPSHSVATTGGQAAQPSGARDLSAVPAPADRAGSASPRRVDRFPRCEGAVARRTTPPARNIQRGHGARTVRAAPLLASGRNCADQVRSGCAASRLARFALAAASNR